MAAPSTSRWGSFLSQAVAGVESRLDNMLAEGEEGAKPQPAKTASPAASGSTTPKGTTAPARTSSARANDRLQERLARAMAAKSAAAAGQKPDASPARSPARTSATASPRASIDAPGRPSTESADAGNADKESLAPDTPARGSLDGKAAEGSTAPQSPSTDANVNELIAQDGTSINGEEAKAPASPPPPQVEITAPEPTPQVTVATTSEVDGVHEARIKKLEEELGQMQKQHQDEIHEYVEKLDALQSKLQYLSKETTDAARKAIDEAPAGSAEKKLAEKDQQIAQLMQEGKNLGVTEQKHRTIIKKLRVAANEKEKETTDLRLAKARADAELDTLRVRAKRAAELEGSQDASSKRLNQVQSQLDKMRSESVAKDRTISDLKSQLARAKEQAEAMTAKLNEEALDKERKRTQDLEEQVAALQVEKNLITDRSKTQATELKEKAERASERARVVEVETKAELQIMESKLEAMRIRAEEASSGAIGDSQAKLLRQVETLQSQYSIANQNWQGIEATLLARITGLEKDRDEALQRESDIRKKAREAAQRAKRQEEELEDARSKLPAIQEDASSSKSEIESLKKRAEQAETNLREAKAELERQKKEDRLDRDRSDSNDRRAWLEDIPSTIVKGGSRPESPLLHQQNSRTWSSDFLSLSGLPNKLRKTSAPSSTDDPLERLTSRRPSAQPPTRPTLDANRAPSSPHPLFSPTTLDSPRDIIEPDDALDTTDTVSSPQHILADMVSVSTVAAGPSVQLVERMSAAIRRLESEKVAAREELARISNQRDEARAEIVALMRRAEKGEEALGKVKTLEDEVSDMRERYETTLELLGEKSEMVEELKADVQDVKDMYKELVERTHR